MAPSSLDCWGPFLFYATGQRVPSAGTGISRIAQLGKFHRARENRNFDEEDAAWRSGAAQKNHRRANEPRLCTRRQALVPIPLEGIPMAKKESKKDKRADKKEMGGRGGKGRY